MTTLRLSSVLLLAACSGGGSSPDLPPITPPVQAAAPAGLVPASASARIAYAISASTIKDRFFSSAGPSDVFSILRSIDARLADISGRTGACVDAAAVPFTVTPFGETVTLQAQCAYTYDGGFVLFAAPPAGEDGLVYLFESAAVGNRAVILTRTGGQATHVEAWLSVGYNNTTSCPSRTFDGCSYGAIHLVADPVSHAFEMSVAGIGLGVCGAQLQSDATTIYAIGSDDMGLTCNAPTSACATAADLAPSDQCKIPTMLLPAIGRRGGGTFGETQYPDPPNLTLDGTMTDDIHFGPTEPPAGVGTL